MTYVLDASAIIAWLRNEPGAGVVDQAIQDANSSCVVHAINLCEVYYDAHRRSGEAVADSVVADLATVGVTVRDDLDEAFWKEAGKLKAGGGISLPDCFGITLTNRIGGTFLTADHGELDKIAAAGTCNITFIR
jgi:PIN domain nuclease of toxin-antitoxin system